MDMIRKGQYRVSAHKGLRYCIALLIFLLPATGLWAQAKTAAPDDVPRPRDVKVLEEHKDKNGNTVRTIEYYQGRDRITETETIRADVGLHRPINPDTLNKDSVLIVVVKSRYTLDVFYKRRKIRSYKAVFGPKPMENKKMAGDRCTPEGWFTIKTRTPSAKYNKFMLLDYPNDSSIVRFNQLKASGAIPKNAAMGGDVGIHGIWKGGDDMIEMGVCWTDGCIALKNKDVDELYTLVAPGTRVSIRK